ncbi:N-ethylmaleimide reductase [Nymphon striatum]|nr:N-ethylmaleimide reductase [Nymphon striatum]
MLAKHGVAVIGVSPDSLESHEKFAGQHKLKFPLLADPDHKIIDKYGVWGEKKNYGKTFMGLQRTTFLIDEKGVIQHVFKRPRVAEHAEEIVSKLTTRASAGLIVSEGVYPSVNGKGYCRTPGLVTDTQVAGWRQVTDAVHAEGGAMVAQIMHCGRVAHADNKPADAETIAPSAITATGDMYTDTAGMQPFDDPREMTADEIIGAIDEHARATSRALEAGFDGVELHGTSGYLSAQFLSTGTNQRSDERRQHRTPVLRTISTCPPEIEPITETAEELLALLTHADTDLLPLLPALAYALGDLSLLVDDLRPDPAKVMEEQAGWTAEQQERCVAIALPALERVRSGEAASEPNLEDLHQIMAWTCGVDLSGSYVTMLAEELAPNNADLRAPDWSKMDVAPDRPFKVAIVGAGMSGILAAHRMQQAGVDYVVRTPTSAAPGSRTPTPGAAWMSPTMCIATALCRSTTGRSITPARTSC